MKHFLTRIPLAALVLCACGGSDSETSDGNPSDVSTGGTDASDAGTEASDAGTDGNTLPETGDDGSKPDTSPQGDAAADGPLMDSGPLDPGVDPAELAAEDEWFCGRSQREVENFTDTTLPDNMIEVRTPVDHGAFEWSKPSVESDRVIVQSFRPNEVERGSAYEQAWCKMKTQAAIEAGLSATPEGASLECKTMNQAVILWALEHVSPQMQAAWDASGITIEFADDQVFGSGNQWLPSHMVIVRDDETTIRIQSKAARVDMDLPIVGRVHYCKLLSPNGAVALVSDVANRIGIGSDGS